ncbi:hypothetical protein UR09_01325 [Candidatus Nitromaritima sp. SCGC AAA799-A02]|nr:hypothetical protein UR09_01325 [Candidatus Nitromaritima sp. SCGC AAA799-A02]
MEERDPEAILELETEEKRWTLPMLKSAVYAQKGGIHALAGEFKKSGELYRHSLEIYENPGACYELAITLQGLNQPRKACDALQKSIDLAEGTEAVSFGEFGEEIVVEAKKELHRLESKKIMNGWFVGSWKVFLVLAGITLLCLFRPWGAIQT